MYVQGQERTKYWLRSRDPWCRRVLWKFSHKVLLVTCPCAFRPPTFAQSVIHLGRSVFRENSSYDNLGDMSMRILIAQAGTKCWSRSGDPFGACDLSMCIFDRASLHKMRLAHLERCISLAIFRVRWPLCHVHVHFNTSGARKCGGLDIHLGRGIFRKKCYVKCVVNLGAFSCKFVVWVVSRKSLHYVVQLPMKICFTDFDQIIVGNLYTILHRLSDKSLHNSCE